MNPRVQYLQYKIEGYKLISVAVSAEQIGAQCDIYDRKVQADYISGRIKALTDTMRIVQGVLEIAIAEMEAERVRKRGFFEKLFAKETTIEDWSKAKREFLAEVHEGLIGLKTIATGDPGYLKSLESMLKFTNVKV